MQTLCLAFGLCTCCDLPQATFRWVLVARINLASVLLSCCVWGSAHAHPFPKDPPLVVEVPLVSPGSSHAVKLWLFMAKLLGFSISQGTGQAVSQLLPHS